ncbi:tetratricopeptide repeat protein 36 homolog [Drosophila albomicans]|uniref:Tetratricopeptide repeat protein 36 homolog n=1 Tax=Drosophila albomicans TaxID=7291 RepID=A0A6P8XBV9_DROAB|nr:tetratricopeptide repeat protein 36 homolog [Drosophila albomicans]
MNRLNGLFYIAMRRVLINKLASVCHRIAIHTEQRVNMPQANLKLSAHDQQVLESVFNPLELSGIVPHNGAIQAEMELIDVEPESENLQASRELELLAVRLTEQGELDEALLKFAEALRLSERASVFNNRAQTLRLAKRDNDALEDLNRALTLASEQQLRTKCHAYCQRGVLHRKLENLDAARTDFEAAAQLGSKFAREQLVEINPFAALCNQMLRQAYDQLK